MKRLIGLLLLTSFCFFQACQKEVSLETGGGAAATGTLQSDVSGECLPKNVAGIYEAGKALKADSNYIEVDVIVTQAGAYTISTDTTNGIYFKASGIFTSTGTVTIKLKGTGTPVADGIHNFVVTFGATSCNVAVIILPAGGALPAVFTLNGAPTTCMNAVPSGTYTVGTALNSSNKVVIEVNVTTAGTYNITTATSNNIVFSGQGVLLAGAQTITLTASGTPSTSGPTNIPVSITTTAGTSSCNFPINVIGPATYTINCAGATVNGTYKQGTPLNAGNTITLPVTVTAIGGYSITGTINGMTFSSSGTFTSTTAGQTVTLTAGTTAPTAAGAFNLPLTGGTAGCTVPITVTAASAIDYFPRTVNSNWSYQYDGDPNDSVLIKVDPGTVTIGGNSFNVFMGTLDASGGFDTSGYFRKSGGDYYRYENLKGYLDLDNDQLASFIFLKDNQPQGHTWTAGPFNGTFGGIATAMRIKFTIKQKDVNVTVNGTSYPNTIVVEEKYEMNISNTGWIDATTLLGSYEDSYSRNVGWIFSKYFYPGGTMVSEMSLRRFVVY